MVIFISTQILIAYSVSKQWRSWSDAAFCGVWSWSALWYIVCPTIQRPLGLYILSVNEKLPVSKFRYFGKYIIQLFGYCYVDFSGQRQTGLERWNSYTSPGTMEHVMHVHFMFLLFLRIINHHFQMIKCQNMPLTFSLKIQQNGLG